MVRWMSWTRSECSRSGEKIHRYWRSHGRRRRRRWWRRRRRWMVEIKRMGRRVWRSKEAILLMMVMIEVGGGHDGAKRWSCCLWIDTCEDAFHSLGHLMFIGWKREELMLIENCFFGPRCCCRRCRCCWWWWGGIRRWWGWNRWCWTSRDILIRRTNGWRRVWSRFHWQSISGWRGIRTFAVRVLVFIVGIVMVTVFHVAFVVRGVFLTRCDD